MKVTFFSNGMTMAFDSSGQQVPDLQGSWFLNYVDSIKDKGIDVTAIDFEMPSGRTVNVFKTENGYNF